MNKKVLATILGCFLMAMLSIGVYYLSNGTRSIIDLNNVSQNTTQSNEDSLNDNENAKDEDPANAQAANTQAEDANGTETQTEGDRVADDGKVEDRENGSEEVVSENTVNSSALTFSENDTLCWPIEGEVILEYSVDNTVYFPTLDEYKINPAIVIQGDEYMPVMAAADGVITEVGENEELGTYIVMSIGGEYEITYGQVINQIIEAGDTVSAGDTIAYIGEPSIYYSNEGYNLYFMLEQDGEPVDPLDYLAYE
ncbi:MAG: peptidoglycan DD-metalloendopeptidase family protein [Eubacterium sp.]